MAQISSKTTSQVKIEGQIKNTLLPLILLTSLFFLWGMANNLNDILIQQFKKAFDLTDFQSGLVQSAFYFGYFLLALPAASVMKKYSYKTGILIGLLLYGLGAFLFYPAALSLQYGYFLFALFVIAAGLAFLETAANPYVAVLGPAESSEKRLNLAQSFNPLGSITGIIVGREFIFSGVEYTPAEIAAMTTEQVEAFRISEAHAVITPYLTIAGVVLLFAAVIAATRFPMVKDEGPAQKINVLGSLKRLSKISHFRLGVLAQFFYVGAQVGIWSYLIRYTQYSLPGTSEKMAADYLMYSLIAFMVGRFVSTALLKYFKAKWLMGVYAIVNSILIAYSIVGEGYLAIWILVGVSFFMSMMFPTIFALSIKGLKEDTQFGSSLVIMAIIGGAVLTALMGRISDISNIKYAFGVPLVCFLFIAYYAFAGSRVSSRDEWRVSNE